jgi:hypothetical protein
MSVLILSFGLSLFGIGVGVGYILGWAVHGPRTAAQP